MHVQLNCVGSQHVRSRGAAAVIYRKNPAIVGPHHKNASRPYSICLPEEHRCGSRKCTPMVARFQSQLRGKAHHELGCCWHCSSNGGQHCWGSHAVHDQLNMHLKQQFRAGQIQLASAAMIYTRDAAAIPDSFDQHSMSQHSAASLQDGQCMQVPQASNSMAGQYQVGKQDKCCRPHICVV